MAFVSQELPRCPRTPLPSAPRFQPGRFPGRGTSAAPPALPQPREQRAKAAGAGSPSRTAAVTSRALLRLGMAQATVPRPGTLRGDVGSSGLSCSSPSAVCPTPGRGQAARTGLQGGVRSCSLAPVPDRAHVSVPSWGRVTAPPGATSVAEPGRRRRRRRKEEGAEPGCRDVPTVLSHRQQK